MFEAAFPTYLKEEVRIVLPFFFQKLLGEDRIGVAEQYTEMRVLTGEAVQLPQRIYFEDTLLLFPPDFTKEQRCIYHCIYTRHHNGYVREKHVKSLLIEYPDELPEWVCPFLLSISGEYIMEILELLYKKLYPRENKTIQAMCLMNSQQFLYIHDRMISYWNEFYRGRCPQYKQYIGRKLFKDCYGYTRSMEKNKTFG